MFLMLILFYLLSRGTTFTSMTMCCRQRMKRAWSRLFPACPPASFLIRRPILLTRPWWIYLPALSVHQHFWKRAAHMRFSLLQIHNGPPHESNFGYAYAKRMIDVHNRYVMSSMCHFYPLPHCAFSQLSNPSLADWFRTVLIIFKKSSKEAVVLKDQQMQGVSKG